MNSGRMLQSEKPSDIKSALISLLDSVTEKEVLGLDEEYGLTKNKIAFLVDFEASDSKTFPNRNPILLEKWTHYRWIRLELTNLAYIQASTNKIAALESKQQEIRDSLSTSQKISQKRITPLTSEEVKKISFKEFQKQIADPILDNISAFVPAVVDSVDQAIQEDYLNGVPIEASINKVRQILLQIVGTEHPTDPLSQNARDILGKISYALNSDNSIEIRDLLRSLQHVDSIPPRKREVVEEVNRNIKITLDKLYDALPQFIDSVLKAYKIYYGDELYLQYEDEILDALEGINSSSGKITTPIERDASWAGFDGDGNTNVTPEAMITAIRLYRIRAAEKHIEVLSKNIVNLCDQISKKLKKNINSQNPNFLACLRKATNDSIILIKMDEFHTMMTNCIIDGDYRNLISLLDEQISYINKVIPNTFTEKETLLNILNNQLECANQLNKLIAFSNVDRTIDLKHQGSIQKLQDIFEEYKKAIRDNTDSFEIKDEKDTLRIPTEYIIEHYNELLHVHRDLLESLPELKKQARYFSIQLRSFGMTYGVGHIRQDSSEYVSVWDAILDDLKGEPEFRKFKVFELMGNKRYKELENQERIVIHKHLQEVSASDNNTGISEGQILLQCIYHKYNSSIYLNEEKYKKNKAFETVRRELERLKIAIQHKDMFENIIISNSESAADILGVASLLKIFPNQHHDVMIVPLLEKRDDLINYESILIEHIKLKISNKLDQLFTSASNHQLNDFSKILGINSKSDIKKFIESHDRESFKKFLHSAPIWLHDALQEIIIEIMVGFSDTERVSGLPALISVQKVQEDFIELAKDFGVKPKIFHGPGGDPNRGGLARRDLKATLQGNARSTVLSNPRTIQRYHETQFNHAHKIGYRAAMEEIKHLPKYIQTLLNTCEKTGAEHYEHLHDKKNGLGKLYGFMLGQGAHWIVNALNSSSRATQRGKPEDNGDRTASVQTGGSRPENYIDPDKPRAITATQMKEMLRDNVDLIFGSGYALSQLGIKDAVTLYKSSHTFRDMVEKTMLGVATSDYSMTAHAYFSEYPELLPRDADERKKWAKECETLYPELLKLINLDEYLKSKDGQHKLRIMMSRLFAYLEEERNETMQFLFKLNHSLHPDVYHEKNAPQTIKEPTDLFYHNPALQKQTVDMIREVSPLSLILARQNSFVANGINLDQKYLGLNQDKRQNSELTGIGRLLGNIGAGITAFRIMMVSFYEKLYSDYSHNLNSSALRAEAETIESRTRKGGKFGLFDESARQNLDSIIKKHSEAINPTRLIRV